MSNKKPGRRLPRRDMCYLTGARAYRLNGSQAEQAWFNLALYLEQMGTLDMPKFKHLLRAIRTATIQAKRAGD